MPLVVVTGRPCTGKTTFSESLSNYLRERGIANVVIVNDEVLGVSKSDGCSDAKSEKASRGALKAAVERHTASDTTVIADGLNYIKGFRYELFCIARSAGTTHAVVHVETSLVNAHAWNTARQRTRAPPSSNHNAEDDRGAVKNRDCDAPLLQRRNDAYPPRVINDIWSRYESPDPRNRWDSPLISVTSTCRIIEPLQACMRATKVNDADENGTSEASRPGLPPENGGELPTAAHAPALKKSAFTRRQPPHVADVSSMHADSASSTRIASSGVLNCNADSLDDGDDLDDAEEFQKRAVDNVERSGGLVHAIAGDASSYIGQPLLATARSAVADTLPQNYVDASGVGPYFTVKPRRKPGIVVGSGNDALAPASINTSAEYVTLLEGTTAASTTAAVAAATSAGEPTWASAFDNIYEAIFNRAPVVPSRATAAVPTASASFIGDLDHATDAVVSALSAVTVGGTASALVGDVIRIPGVRLPFMLTRSLMPLELGRLRHRFVQASLAEPPPAAALAAARAAGEDLLRTGFVRFIASSLA